MKTTDELINELANDLEPVTPVKGIAVRNLSWLAATAAFALLAIHWYGPIRPGAMQQLLEHPRFLLEIVFGSATIIMLSLAAFRTAIPGALSSRVTTIALAMLALWLAGYVIGMVSPALEPSMLGKRDHCVVETFLYGLPPALLGMALCARLYPLDPAATAFRIGLAAGLVPALYMQVACMYDPVHAITLHMLPGILVGVGCAGMCWLRVQRKRNLTASG